MIVCPSCGRESAGDAAFCARCGTSLVPPRDAPEERKVVSIVFADLVGSTARAEQLEAIAFFQRVGAAAYLGRAEALL